MMADAHGTNRKPAATRDRPVNAAVAFGSHLRAAGHEVEACCTSQGIDFFDQTKVKVAIVPREEMPQGPSYRWEPNRSELALVDSVLYRVGESARWYRQVIEGKGRCLWGTSTLRP